jgi:hypothetical protein
MLYGSIVLATRARAMPHHAREPAQPVPSSAGNRSNVNIHAFSYVNTSPTISQRVVNETAAIVEYLNHLPQ